MFHEGQQIGLYTLIGKLGKGGFGEVWLAEKRSQFVTKRVAVKLPLDEQVNFDAIRQEAELWEQASGHANVLPIIDADIYDGQVVIVSEYANGGSLHDKLKTEGKLPIKQAVEMTIGILNGLEFLHNKRIIHRDIKPQNILLQGETPRLADFGTSRAMTDSSLSMTIAGTSEYMAIEAFSGKRDEQTDIFASGVILYLLLTGKLPFLYRKEITKAIITDNETSLRQYKDEIPAQLPNEVPQELHRVVERALAKLPANRYKKAKMMREDLELFVQVNYAFVNQIKDETELQTKARKNETEDETEIQTELRSVQTEIKTVVRQQIREASERIGEEIDKTEQLLVVTIKDWGEIEAEKLAEKKRQEAERKRLEVEAKEVKATNKTTIRNGIGALAVMITVVVGFDFIFFGKVGIGALVVMILLGGVIWMFVWVSLVEVRTYKATKVNSMNSNNLNTLTGSIEMEFVRIPAGSFMMGSKNGYLGHKETILTDFYMGKYEVTQAHYIAIMGSNPSYFKGDNLPVENVSLQAAKEFIKKLNAKGEGIYRFPTKAEWEYACRAGTTGDYYGNLDSIAWYDKNSGNKTHEVGTKQPNAFGLYDMHGNVWEWVEDWRINYPSGTVAYPTKAELFSTQAIRGGGWSNSASFLSSAYCPSAPSNRRSNLGFRVVRQ